MSSVIVAGDVSGSVSLTAPSAAGSTVITLPATSGTMALAGGAVSGTTGTFSGALSATTGTFSGVITAPAGSAAAPAITTSGNTNTGISFPATDVVALNAAGAERMRVTQAWGVLIETTANPSSSVSGLRFVKGGNQMYASWSHGPQTSTSEYIYWQNGNGIVGSISSNGSTTSYNTSSDYRLKDNVSPISNALATVALLKPVTYTWKADGTAGQGFIAHELQAVVPDAVTGEKDAVNEDGSIKSQGIDTSYLVATLTAAIQELAKATSEQQALIENLTTRLSALENK